MHVQAAELADLEDEANIPLEQLLARYGYTTSTSVATVPTPPSASPSSIQLGHTSQPDTTSDPTPTDISPKLKPNAESKHQAASSPVKQEQSSVAAQEGANAQQETDFTKAGAANVTEAQAHQAAAVGMDAFEHNQALAERRASGSMAGPSTAIPSAPGMSLRLACEDPFLLTWFSVSLHRHAKTQCTELYVQKCCRGRGRTSVLAYPLLQNLFLTAHILCSNAICSGMNNALDSGPYAVHVFPKALFLARTSSHGFVIPSPIYCTRLPSTLPCNLTVGFAQ